MDLSIEEQEQLVAALGEQAAMWYPSLFAPPTRIWASIEDVLEMSPAARGELAEARLVAKLMEMGLMVAKPFGNTAKWDLIVEAPGKISRLQVKSSWVTTVKKLYHVNTALTLDHRSGRRRRYEPNEVDFLVCYIGPEDTWFIFPVELIRSQALDIGMRPDWRFAGYREKWDLLFQSPGSPEPELSEREQ